MNDPIVKKGSDLPLATSIPSTQLLIITNPTNGGMEKAPMSLLKSELAQQGLGGGGASLSKANTYFDNATVGTFNGTATRVDDVLLNLVDDYTGEAIAYKKITGVTNSNIDKVLIVKKGAEYFERILPNTYINVLWFSSYNVSNNDWSPAFQKAIDVAIANKISNVLIPVGSYSYSKPLMLYKWNGTNYEFFSLTLRGEGCISEPDQSGTNLNYTGTDGFGIGVQLGKGVQIKNLKIKGNYVPRTFANSKEMYNSTYTSYMVGNTFRDSRYSPHAGIVIDPFRNTNNLPADGGYPSMNGANMGAGSNATGWYRGDGSMPNSGSTSIKIHDCKMSGFVVPGITSPNGVTQNAEIVHWERLEVGNYKVGFAGCQDQERTNILKDVQAWGQGHTFYTNTQYGAATSGHWKIENCNLAGANVQLFDIITGGRYPVNIHNITAESFAKLGSISCGIGMKISDCTFDFAKPDEAGYQEVISVSGVTFENCNLRYYGVGVPLRLGGESVYRECTFNAYPMTNIPAFNIRSRLIDCNNGTIGLQGTRQVNKTDNQYFSCYGNYKLRGVENTDVHVERFLIQEGYEDLYTGFNLQTCHFHYNGDGTIQITLSDAVTDQKFLTVGRVVMTAGSFWGVITAVQQGGFTLGYSSDTSAAAGATYDGGLTIYYPLIQFGTFMGDLDTNEPNKIKNCSFVGGWGSNPYVYIGNVIKSEGCISNAYSPYCLIIDYDANTKTFTTTNVYAPDVTGVVFNNGARQEICFANVANGSEGHFLAIGDTITVSQGPRPAKYTTVKSGMWQLGYGDTRLAKLIAFERNPPALTSTGVLKKLVVADDNTITAIDL